MKILYHFIQGTWVSVDFVSHRGVWNQSPTDIEEHQIVLSRLKYFCSFQEITSLLLNSFTMFA